MKRAQVGAEAKPGKKTKFTFMVGFNDFDDDEGAYLQQHTRNSAALERRGREGELLLATTAT